MNLTDREGNLETYKHTEVTKLNYNTMYVFFVSCLSLYCFPELITQLNKINAIVYKRNTAAVGRFSNGCSVCNHKPIQRSEKIRKTDREIQMKLNS